jgi:hypothetical protein
MNYSHNNILQIAKHGVSTSLLFINTNICIEGDSNGN